MPVSVIAPFLIYCFINSISPGPANLCSLSAALRYGKQAALRQWRGLAAGFIIDSLAAVLIVRLLGVGLFLPLTGPSCNLVWLFAGVRLKTLFARYKKTIDILMALALALCAINLVLPR